MLLTLGVTPDCLWPSLSPAQRPARSKFRLTSTPTSDGIVTASTLQAARFNESRVAARGVQGGRQGSQLKVSPRRGARSVSSYVHDLDIGRSKIKARCLAGPPRAKFGPATNAARRGGRLQGPGDSLYTCGATCRLASGTRRRCGWRRVSDDLRISGIGVRQHHAK